MTTEDLINFYVKLLIIQYANKSKAMATVSAYVTEVIADQVYGGVRDAFDLDTAVGEQLDILGAYRGVGRFIFGLDLTKNYFSMPSTADADKGTVPGFASAGDTDADITWFWFSASDFTSVSYKMNDQEYRNVIKLRAAVHSSSLGVGEIDLILQSFFGNYVTLVDNKNMTIVYNNSPLNPSDNFTLAKNSNSLPAPAGVGISYTTV